MSARKVSLLGKVLTQLADLPDKFEMQRIYFIINSPALKVYDCIKILRNSIRKRKIL